MDDRGRCFVAVDCKVSGSSPKKHYMVAIGAIAIQVKFTGARKKYSTFYRAMKPPGPDRGFEPKHERDFWNRTENARLLARFTEEATDPGEAMTQFARWLNGLVKLFGSGLYLILDSGAKSTWVDYYLIEHGGGVPLSEFTYDQNGCPYYLYDWYRALTGMADTSFRNGVLAVIPKPAPGNGDPIDDARETCERFIEMLLHLEQT